MSYGGNGSVISSLLLMPSVFHLPLCTLVYLIIRFSERQSHRKDSLESAPTGKNSVRLPYTLLVKLKMIAFGLSAKLKSIVDKMVK